MFGKCEHIWLTAQSYGKNGKQRTVNEKKCDVGVEEIYSGGTNAMSFSEGC